MDPRTHSANSAKPDSFGAFMGGFGTGAFNGALMVGIFSTIMLGLRMVLTDATLKSVGLTAIGSTTFGAVLAPILLTMAATAVATGIFVGLTSMNRAHDEHKSARQASREVETYATLPVAGMTINPELAAPDVASPSSSWSERVGGGSANRIQSILDQGASPSKDRASAILAERENASTTPGMGAA